VSSANVKRARVAAALTTSVLVTAVALWSCGNDSGSGCPVLGYAYTHPSAGPCAPVGNQCVVDTPEWGGVLCNCVEGLQWHCCGHLPFANYGCSEETKDGDLCCPAAGRPESDCIAGSRLCTCDGTRWHCGPVDAGADLSLSSSDGL
jgi:hypothetical protein